MTVTFVGELSIGAVIPAAVALLATAKADLSAKLQALIDFSLQLGLPALSFSAQLALLAEIEAALVASLSIGLTPPSLSIQLEATLVAIATLKLELQLYIDLFALLANGGVFTYAYDGQTNNMGSEFTTELAGGLPGHGPTVHMNALVLGTVSGATWAAMTQVFKTA